MTYLTCGTCPSGFAGLRPNRRDRDWAPAGQFEHWHRPMSDPTLWFGQLASLLGAMPKTKLISFAWSLPIFSSFFECSPTIEIPACPVTKSAQITASSFPHISESPYLNCCAWLLPQDSHSPRLEAAWGCQDPMLGFPLPCCPHCCWCIHIWTFLTPTACLDCFPWPHSAEQCQPARHLTRPTLCLPVTHHFVTPIATISCSLWWSVWCLVLAIPHLASVLGSHVQNLMYYKGIACL